MRWLIACQGDNDELCPEADDTEVRVVKSEPPDGSDATLRIFFRLDLASNNADLLDIDIYRNGSEFEDES